MDNDRRSRFIAVDCRSRNWEESFLRKLRKVFGGKTLNRSRREGNHSHGNRSI